MNNKYEKKLTKINGGFLLIGNWLSNIGNRIFDYANSILLLSLGGKAVKLLAIYQSSETVISIIFNLFGGVMADGGKKKRICVITDLIAAMICIMLALLLDTSIVGIIVVTANALLACVGAFNAPTYKSLIREVIIKEKILKFNSLMHAVNEGISLCAPVLALILVKYINISGALILDGITFIVSAILEMFLKPLPEYEHNTFSRRNVILEIINGFRYILQDKWIFCLVVMSACINFFLAAYNLSLPFTETIIEENYYSKILIAEAIGGIIGSIVCSYIAGRNAPVEKMICYLGLSGFSLLFIPKCLSIFNNKYIILLFVLLFTVFMTLYNVTFSSYVQANISKEYIGRVFGILNTIALLFAPLGSIIFSFLIKYEDLKVYYVVGIGIIIISFISFFAKRIIFNEKINN